MTGYSYSIKNSNSIWQYLFTFWHYIKCVAFANPTTNFPTRWFSEHPPWRGVVGVCLTRALAASWSGPSLVFWTDPQRFAGCQRNGMHTQPNRLYCCCRKQTRICDQLSNILNAKQKHLWMSNSSSYMHTYTKAVDGCSWCVKMYGCRHFKELYSLS